MRLIFIIFFLFPTLCYSQNRITHDTTNLVNGSGLAFLVSTNGKAHGFATYRDYTLNGKYYITDSLENFALTGEFKTDSTCMNYIPGIKVKYRTAEKPDTLTMTVDTSLFRAIFEYTTSTVFSREPTSVPKPTYGVHPELSIVFSNPAFVPVGKWQRLDIKKKYVFVDFYFDDCGNPMLTRYYNPDGSVLKEFKFLTPERRKREW